LLYEFVNHTFW